MIKISLDFIYIPILLIIMNDILNDTGFGNRKLSFSNENLNEIKENLANVYNTNKDVLPNIQSHLYIGKKEFIEMTGVIVNFSFTASQLLKHLIIYYLEKNYDELHKQQICTINDILFNFENQFENELKTNFIEFNPNIDVKPYKKR